MQESLMVTCIINAMEVSEVDVSDTPGAFLHIDMVYGDRKVRVRLCGVLADLLVKIEP